MRQKILLLFSLVLLTMRGWASPVDSLETHSRGDLIKSNWNVLNIKDTLLLADSLHCKTIPFDGVSCISPEDALTFWDFFVFVYHNVVEPWLGFLTNWHHHVSSGVFRDVTLGKTYYIRIPCEGFIKGTLVADLEYPEGTPRDCKPFSFCESNLQERMSCKFESAGTFEDYYTIYYKPTSLGSDTVNLHFSYHYSNEFFVYERHSLIVITGNTVDRTVTTTQLNNDIPVSSLSFSNAKVGRINWNGFTVSVPNLTDSLIIAIDDPSNSFFFSKEGEPFSEYSPVTSYSWEDQMPIIIEEGQLPIVVRRKLRFSAEEAANGVPIHVGLFPTTAGTYNASIKIYGGGALEKTLSVTGSAVLPDTTHTISVDYTSLNFGTHVKGESIPKSFTVTGTNLSNDLILSLPSDCSHYTISQTRITPNEAAVGKLISVTYTPKTVGTHNVSLTINEEGRQDSLWVNLSGKCVANPTITVNPTSLDFETIEVGQEKPMTINVSGTDLTGPITVTKEETIGDQFSINKETLSASGGSIIVTYKPTEAGTHGGCIRISGGDATAVSVSLTGIARELSVTKSSLDFGTIKKNETATRKFTVYGGNLLGDVTLLSSKPDLFEVIPETITPAEAKAGKEVTVIYKPTAGGTHSGKIIVSAEGVTNKEVSVSGKCAEIKVNKTSLNFGTIEVGNDTTITLNVTGINVTGTISVKKEETHDGQFTISRETLSASGGSVIVTFKPTEAGSFGGIVRISGEGALPVSVSLAGSARQLSVTKTSLDFGTTKKNGSVTRKFTVYGGNLSGNVTLTSSNAKFTVTPATITPAEAKAGKEVTVTYKPTAGGTHSGKVIVSASGVTPKSVSVSGKCAVISSNPTSYNFGNVAVGKPVTKEIIVTGTNLTSAMSITLAETEGGQFTINKNTLPASGGTIIVTFKPTDAKTFGASLNISGGSASAVSIDLSGKGVTPTITRNKTELDYSGSAITYEYVKITGTNLDDVISLEVTGSGRTHFTLSTNTISISDAAEGKQVKVTCNPKNASSADATLEISSPYATTKKVTLKFRKGSSGGGETQICSVEPEDGSESGNNEFMNEGSLEMMRTSTTDVNELSLISKIYAEGLNIIIESPVEQTAVISDISGRARNVNLQVGRNEIPINASGIYIVRIREKTTKLMLK